MENIAEKVKLLLNLSKSSNPHEAASAAAKAQELLHKYNLTMFDVEGINIDKDPTYNKSIIPGFVGWRIQLFNIIAKANNGYVVKLSDGKASLIAKDSSKEVIIHIYEYLSRECERLAEYGFLRADTSEHGKTWKHSFRMGFINIIYQRLKDKENELKKESTQSTAMVLVADKKLNTAVTFFYPKLRKSAFTTRIGDNSAFRQGQEAGRNISMNQAVGAGNTRRILQ